MVLVAAFSLPLFSSVGASVTLVSLLSPVLESDWWNSAAYCMPVGLRLDSVVIGAIDDISDREKEGS